MRRVTTFLLLVVSILAPCFGEETQRPPDALHLGRVLYAYMDVEILMRIAALELSDAQLQALAAFYQEHPFAPPDLKLVEAVADKVEAFRLRLISGTPTKPEDMQALGQEMQAAFTQFNPMAELGKTVKELTVDEKELWGMLTQKQQAALLQTVPTVPPGLAQVDPAHPPLTMLKRLRDIADDQEWVKERDRLAQALAAAAGAEGTPERENRRRMFVEFFNRVEQMPEADFVAKLNELGAELAALLPAGADAALALAEADPTRIHMALLFTFLNPRYPVLLHEMQAAKAKAKPGQ